MHKYDVIVDLIRKRVSSGTLKIGDRLPSVRQLSLLTGYSTVTVHHGYELLESLGICSAKPRSGFYLTKLPPQLDDFPTVTPEGEVEPIAAPSLPEALLLTWRRKGLEAFGAFYPSSDLFNRVEIDKVMRQVLRKGTMRSSGAELPEGDPLLRQQIAKRAAQRGAFVRYQDIIITGSGMQGFGLCLDALTTPGDVVLVETPSYFPMLAAVKHRNLRLVELYSHPVTGVDPEQFEYLLKNNPINTAIFMASQHYPTGITYSDSTMQRIVAAADRHGVTILENDMFGELGHVTSNVSSLKQFDSNDTVIQFSSFENSLSPEYGLGWILAGRHSRRLLATQYLSGYTTRDGLVQRTIAEYLTSRSQDRYLRQVRQNLAERMKKGMDLVVERFPPGCSISQPVGGFMCWVRMTSGADGQAISAMAVKENISVLPGSIFSADGSFKNFLALNFSFPWTPQNELGLHSLATMVSRSARPGK